MPQHPKFYLFFMPQISSLRVFTVCRKLVYIQTKKIPSMSDEIRKKNNSTASKAIGIMAAITVIGLIYIWFIWQP